MTHHEIIIIINTQKMEGKTYRAKELLSIFGYAPTTYIKDTNLKSFISKVKNPSVGIDFYEVKINE